MLREELIKKVYTLLEKEFKPLQCSLRDESHLHKAHSEGGKGAHFHLHIQSLRFNGKKMLDCHRMVYACLEELLEKEIHALSIKCEAAEK